MEELTAFSQIPLALLRGVAATLRGQVCSLGSQPPIGWLVLQHLLDDGVLREVHL